LRLYTYFHSSAAYRVRIALNIKGLQYSSVPVHLLRNGGEHLSAEYARLNPARLVPVLEDGGATLTPTGAAARARVRALALDVACDIHPLNNLRVRRYLSSALGLGDAQREDWIRHWIALGFEAIERSLAADAQTGDFCHGDFPTLADCCLVPQVANAQRAKLPLEPYPTLRRINENCLRLRAFADAAPAAQPDAE
jgi:glutathione S-transferase